MFDPAVFVDSESAASVMWAAAPFAWTEHPVFHARNPACGGQRCLLWRPASGSCGCVGIEVGGAAPVVPHVRFGRKSTVTGPTITSHTNRNSHHAPVPGAGWESRPSDNRQVRQPRRGPSATGAITFLFTAARCRRQRDRRSQRVAAGAAATKSPACAVANANNATAGGKLFCAGVPGAATMLIG